MNFRILLCVLLQYEVIVFASGQTFPIVNTPSGPIKGVVVPTLGKDIVQFRNIPYAKPPVGNLRFEKPLPVEPWTETLDGTVFGPSCIQDKSFYPELWENMPENPELTEDCLQLNVYVPGSVLNDVKKPVMFWIHGGGFILGNSWESDGSLIAMKDVIVVTINYRLGLFGFLSTGDTSLPSNFGLWDMIEALKWVNQNIASFGGDPESVTIFGESAGGFAVSYLAVIPSTAGLFKRIIPQSGSAVGFMGIAPNPAGVANAAGKALGCIADENEDISNKNLIVCLKTKSADELLNIQQNPGIQYTDTFSLLPQIWPIIDGELLRRSPYDSLNYPDSEESSYFRSLDMMTGTTSNEGSLLSIIMSELQEPMGFNITEGIPTTVLCDVVAPTLAKEMFNDDTVVSDLLCKEYTAANIKQQGRNIANLYSDAWFNAPTVQLLEFHSKHNKNANTYQYLYTQTLTFPYAIPEYPWMEGAGHSTELVYMFGPKGMNEMDASLSTNEGRAFTDVLVNYWTNFAKSGNPNGDGLVQWKEFTPDNRNYMELKFQPIPGQNLYGKRIKYLLQEIPNKLKKNVKTEL
ncbi:fatty acyl-CoA hydrolase precursor, medium chain-like [Ylistrum balloti]|uniref:fatty acyl-CoA hydrolase precursor, medium chain-like n=1 Tax=Ylistrum balloti TaxID=509963 RepID=UPI0029058964|nr:fatty acyl-CoA hydrolase precursor, medium chain-like [Ylistrum balloti]